MADNDSSNMVLRTVYLPPELDAELRDLALVRRISKGELMRALIQKSLAEERTPRRLTIAVPDRKDEKPKRATTQQALREAAA